MVELHYTQLKNFIKPSELPFESTKDIEAYKGLIGQERAAAALSFGLNVKSKGYNLYVCGSPGTGKTTFSRHYAEQIAANEPTPDDLCYIYNFKNPKCPRILTLPAGEGKILKEEMDELLNRLLTELPKLYSSKDYEGKKMEIIKGYQNKRDEIVRIMTDEAKELNFGVKTTGTGIYFMPIIEGEVINEEQFDALTPDQKDIVSKNSDMLQKKTADIMHLIRDYEKCTQKEVEDLEFSVGFFAVGQHIGSVLKKYENNQQIIDFLLEVKEDILDNLSEFLEDDSESDENLPAYLPWHSKKNPEDFFTKYKVNVLTDNSELSGAPVIMEFNPTYSNLVGEIEYDNEYGNFSTDFMKIKPGVLHKANGGYLILQASDIFENVHAWETLRRTLLTGEIVTEPLREYTTGVIMSGIKPKPVKVNLKVIIVGTGLYYDVLYQFDEYFQKLFKIRVDFDYEMNSGQKNITEISKYIKSFVEKEKTMEFTSQAVARVIEYSSRLAERQDKLSSCFNKLNEVLLESSVWAKIGGASEVSAVYIDRAIKERENRLNMYEEKLNEMIERGIIMIDTTGMKIGQINGLAVIDTGDYVFAKPTRITATTYVGKAGIVNIEKEAEMSGSIHDKGVQVLTGYLGQIYAQDFPLSLSCRICFEQNYNGIDGDSASSTELYAILSSLAELPINQEIAVTGSINQRGEIQPIGGVTYKVEGFFDLCKQNGLTGKQGVIIPYQNVNELVLKDDVIEAVKDGMFHIYPIQHIDEGIELLTGTRVGVKNDKGKYPSDSVHGKVMKKLKDFCKRAVMAE